MARYVFAATLAVTLMWAAPTLVVPTAVAAPAGVAPWEEPGPPPPPDPQPQMQDPADEPPAQGAPPRHRRHVDNDPVFRR